MSLAKTIEAPSWISTGATITGGLDLLGLRLPVQVIGGGLLDGITSVSPSVRYIAFRCWFIQCYGRSGLADTRDGFAQFSARLEAALVLANLIGDRRTTGLIGSDEALKRLDENPEELAISPLVQTPAATVYAGPSYQLGVTRARDDAVPSLTRERGLPLAESVEQYLSTNSLIKRLLSEPELERVPIDDLRELGAAVRIDEIPDRERELLVTTIVPERPLARERARVGTYASLLLLARNLRKRPTESKYFGAACSMERFGEPLLDDTADGWTAYCVRDSIAVTQEAVLGAVMHEITGDAAAGGTSVRRDRIIGPLLERVQDHSEALRDLGLLVASESVGDFSYRRLASRIEEHLREGAVEQANGIVRWPSSFIETRLYNLAPGAGAGALSLALVAWIVAAIRVGAAIPRARPEHAGLSYQGRRRMGLADVVLPELDRFQREDKPWLAVAGELAYRTVEQHLQIAWSRLLADPKRDVALLTTDGNRWYSRDKTFTGGRTLSRLPQALGWLTDLRLLNSAGLTADGDDALHRALQVLAETRGE